MKLLCLSDLHLRSEAVVKAIDWQLLSPFLAQIAATVADVSPDAVVVTGDTVSPAQVRLLSATLRTLIPDDLPVVAMRGNHEFWGRTFEDTLAKLKEQTLAAPNIFYLDLIGAVELDGVNFVGGTLFFDGSMRIRDNQRVDDWDGWQDWRIFDIESRYMEFNAYYVDMIWGGEDEAWDADRALHTSRAARPAERARAEPLQLLHRDEGSGPRTAIRPDVQQLPDLRPHTSPGDRRGRSRIYGCERRQRLRRTEDLYAGSVIHMKNLQYIHVTQGEL